MDPEVPRLAWDMWKRFLLAGFVVVVLSAAATATAGLLEVRGVANALSKGKRLHVPELTAAEAGAPQTILLMGSDVRAADRRAGRRGNSDTMILVRLDPRKKAVAVLSIPRDLKVTIRRPNGKVQIDKINAAFPLGGARLMVRTIHDVLDIPINHVVNVNFRGFREAVNYIGCVYADIDRHYFNDNPAFAEINVQPGYQKMCGQKALDYVRYRHTDTDLVRAARQQDFLRQAKQQTGTQRIIADRQALARIFGRYTQTDIRGTTEILRIAKLVLFSAGLPIREVHFQTNLGPSFVTSTATQLRATRNEFLNGGARTGTPNPRVALPVRRRAGAGALGLDNYQRSGEDQAIQADTQLRFPVLYPRLLVAGSTYDQPPRTYVIQDEHGVRHQAYRMVIRKGSLGEYYGIQGMTWRDPPILQNPSETRTIARRKFSLFFDGSKLRLVVVHTPRAVYWVSNTLLLSVTNRQMLAIARSLGPVGRSPAG